MQNSNSVSRLKRIPDPLLNGMAIGILLFVVASAIVMFSGDAIMPQGTTDIELIFSYVIMVGLAMLAVGLVTLFVGFWRKRELSFRSNTKHAALGIIVISLVILIPSLFVIYWPLLGLR